jgi:hypothetical protein
MSHHGSIMRMAFDIRAMSNVSYAAFTKRARNERKMPRRRKRR